MVVMSNVRRRSTPKPTVPQHDLRVLAKHVSETAIAVANFVAPIVMDAVRENHPDTDPRLAQLCIDYTAAVEAFRKAEAP